MTDTIIRVIKSERCLQVLQGAALLENFQVVLGVSPAGHKEMEGDGKTPEGEYFVFAKNPKSKFFRSLALSYPSPEDAERGLRSGSIDGEVHDAVATAHRAGARPPQNTALGGEIYIHGGGLAGDWTRGCIALDDRDMARLFEMIEIGTRVSIVP